MKRLAWFGALGGLWYGLWLLLVEKFTPDELLVGIPCALLAAAASQVAWQRHLTAFGANPRLLAQAFRLPWIFVTDTWEIAVVLFAQLLLGRPAQSLLLEVPFDAGEEQDPDAAARRALAIAYTTMTPSFVVVGIDRERRTLLYHQIRKSKVPRMTRELGARP